MDNLAYTYTTGNQLSAVLDNAGASYKGELFVDGNTSGADYSYDANGNMKTDLNKGITTAIVYNYLNLPQTVSTPSATINYTYDATGQKLKKVAGTSTTEYIGGIHYENNSVTFIQTAEGRVSKSGSIWTYEYNLKDHLGNVRVSFRKSATGTAELLQKDDYYSFGLTFNSFSSGAENLYKYNGKEEQKEWGVSDYGWRMYEPTLGRFFTQDRFSEKYSSMSPYQYAANNPVMFIDVNGDSLWITHRTGFLGLGKKQTLLYENGNLSNKDGSAYTGKVKGFLGKTVSALNEIGSGKEGATMLDEIQSSSSNITIVKGDGNNAYEPSTNTLEFSPSSTTGGLNTQGSTTRPSFIGLGHEMAHGLDDIRGTLKLALIPGQTFTKAEHFATHMENKLRAEHFLPLRQFYGIDGATRAGTYPLINSSGQSLHNGGYNYYEGVKLQPKRAYVPATATIPSIKIN